MVLKAEHQQAHICQCLSRIVTLRRHSPLTIFGKRRKTGLQFVQSVQTLALSLRQLGLTAGDVVAIAALNSDWYLEWLLAVTSAGGIIAPLNYRWSFKEARLALEVLRPVMLVVDENCALWYTELQNNNLSSIRWHVHLGDFFPILRSTGNALSLVLTTGTLTACFQTSPPFEYCWAPDGIALICFTSGTTGKPKGVAIGHTALIVQSLAKIALVGYSEDDVYLHTAPLCHIGGISSGLAMLMVGACHVILPKFGAESVLKAIEEHHVSSVIAVPTMMADLISCIRNQKSWKAGGILKRILNGGGGLSVELTEDAAEIFPNAKLLSAYDGGKFVTTCRSFWCCCCRTSRCATIRDGCSMCSNKRELAVG